MQPVKSVALVIITALLIMACSDKKESNPLQAKNSPPTLQIIGFAEDTLTYVESSKYAFQFRAADPDHNALTVTAKSRNNSGTVEMTGSNSDGIYRANYTPTRKGGHTIEITVSDKIEQVSDNLTVFFLDNALPMPVIKYREINRNVNDTLFTYEFDASESSDPDGKIGRVTWDLDGKTVTDLVTNKVTHNFDRYGLYNIGLYVFDEHNAFDSTSTLINNSLPQLTISANKAGGDFPLTVSFSAEASNYDNSAIAFAWDFGDGSTSSRQNPTYTFNQEGEYVVVCAASDRIGTVEDSITISSSDQPPVAKFNISPATNTINGDQVIFNASGSYDNNGIKQFTWFIKMPNNRTNQLGVVQGEIFNYSVHTRVGDNHIGLVVEDFTSNVSDTSWVALTVENQSPNANFEVQSTSFKIQVIDNPSNDPDPYDALSYAWFIADKEVREASNQALPEFTFSDAGNYEVTLRVMDPKAAIDEAHSTVFVPGKPTARLESVEVTTNNQGLTLDGSQSAGSGNLKIVKHYFYLLDTGQILLNEGATDDATFTYADRLVVGSHRFGLVVEDENNVQSDLATISVNYANTPPQAEFSYSIGLERVIITDNTASDIDPQDALTFQWFANAERLPEFDDAATPTLELIGGIYEITLRVTDNHGGIGEKTERISVPGRSVADFAFPNNQATFAAYNKSDVALDATSSDAGNEGGGIAMFVWYVKYPDDSVVSLGDTVASQKTITTDYPVGVNQIGLKISNNAGVESDVVWKNLTILNTAPVVDFTTDKTQGRYPFTVECTNLSSDPNDRFDVLTYEWLLNDVDISTTEHTTVTITSGGAHTIKLKVYENGTFAGSAQKQIFSWPVGNEAGGAD